MSPTFRFALVVMGLATAGAVFSQAYPSRPVKILVPFAAGGPADIHARFLAPRLQDALGQSFVVENRPGAGSVIGTDAAAKAAPDGYTLLVISSAHTVNETLIANKPYNLMRDLVAVAPLNSSDLVLVAHPSLPVANLRELIARAKSQPGKLNYASSGPGTPYHMAGELFKSMAGVYLVHIPYRGSTGARSDLISGQVDLMFDAVPTMLELIKSGKVRAIATAGRQRSDVLPDVPTLGEAGVPGYESGIWLGLMAPKGTPKAIVDKLNETVSKILSQPEVKLTWAKQGATPMVISPEVFDKYMRDDVVKWAAVIKSANIVAD